MGDAERVLGVNLQGWTSEWGCESPQGKQGTHTCLTCAEQAGAEVVVRRQGAEREWRPR